MGLVRIWKASKLARDNHILERERLGLVKTWKAGKLARDTHILESAEVGIGKNIESKLASKGHSHPGEGRSWDW